MSIGVVYDIIDYLLKNKRSTAKQLLDNCYGHNFYYNQNRDILKETKDYKKTREIIAFLLSENILEIKDGYYILGKNWLKFCVFMEESPLVFPRLKTGCTDNYTTINLELTKRIEKELEILEEQLMNRKNMRILKKKTGLNEKRIRIRLALDMLLLTKKKSKT